MEETIEKQLINAGCEIIDPLKESSEDSEIIGQKKARELGVSTETDNTEEIVIHY